MEYKIVEATQWLKSNFFDAFFNVVSWFGTELFFLIVFTILYWAYKREFALKFGLFFLISYAVNGLTKIVVNRTRPNGGEHSFPSGHSQHFAMQSSLITTEVFSKENVSKKRKWLLVIELAVAWFVIAYARLYFSYHFLTDVLAGLLFAILLCFVCNFVYDKLPNKYKTLQVKHIIMYVGMCLSVAIIILFSVKQTMLKGEDYLMVYNLAGAVFGVCVGDILNDRFVNYNPSGDDIKARVVKCLLGISFMVLYYYFIVIRFASKLAYLLPGAFAIMMFIATFVFPIIFKKWSNEDKRIKEFEDNQSK